MQRIADESQARYDVGMKAKSSSAVKKIRKVRIPSGVVKGRKPKSRGLSKKDPEFYSKIGKLSAKKRSLSSEDYAEMAKLSHPRREYKGGRKKKLPPKVA